MNGLKLAVCALGFFFLQNSASAQCGCGSRYVPSVVRQIPSHALPAPIIHSTPRPAGSISYVNELSQPIDRGSYTLKYAIHLSDGRILLSDFLPHGQTIRGTEYQSGGRKMVAAVGASGGVTVTDPLNSTVIATFAN